MERNIKCKPTNLCMIIFMLCLSVRFVEYFLIETDKTAIGENVLHKVVGIILLALALKKINLTWRDIGFQRTACYWEPFALSFLLDWNWRFLLCRAIPCIWKSISAVFL